MDRSEAATLPEQAKTEAESGSFTLTKLQVARRKPRVRGVRVIVMRCASCQVKQTPVSNLRRSQGGGPDGGTRLAS
jgi:hypothetical protein